MVVLSADHNIAHAVEAARAGVAAWVAKEQGAAELETVVRGVCQGYSWFPPDMLGAILRELRADVSRAREHDDLLDVLSPRERDVLLSMMDGKRGRQIAQDLLISTDTVRTHTRNIFAKLDVHSRLEAVRVARAAGLRRRDRRNERWPSRAAAGPGGHGHHPAGRRRGPARAARRAGHGPGRLPDDDHHRPAAGWWPRRGRGAWRSSWSRRCAPPSRPAATCARWPG